MLQKLQKEIRTHKLIYILLFAVFGIGLFIRIYRVDQILGFYFDQGRDALVLWDLWHKGKFFLIGPTTGIAGIFRGPFYYYLIAPFYLLGRGNPVFPAIGLAIISMFGVVMVYFLGIITHSRLAGIFGAIIAAFSFQLMVSSRWLSNPTPMLLLSLLLIWMMILVSKGKTLAWVGIAFLSGSSLFHFGSSGEFFYFPALAIFALWQWKVNRPSLKVFLVSIFAFFLTAAPLIFFDIRHDGLLLNNIKTFLFEKDSFKSSFWEVIQSRINFYYEVFSSKIFHWRRQREILLLAATGISFLIFLPRFVKNTNLKIILLVLLSPLVGLLFFQGNYGNIYDYYLTGYYLIFVLLLGIVLGELFKYRLGKLFVLVFLYVFVQVNLEVNKFYVTLPTTGENSIFLGNQKQAVEWVYQDAKDLGFNVDVYVPPVIPYAYDYLFTWLPTTPRLRGTSGTLVKNQVELLYTLYEVDPSHPERLQAWLDRQEGIGVVEKQERFGGITVQRRKRI